MLRVTTTESPFLPYMRHYAWSILPRTTSIRTSSPPLRADSESEAGDALGTDDEFFVGQYQAVLLDTLVHEINTVRAVLGEPVSLDYVDLREGHATVPLITADRRGGIHWVETPDMTRYSMEFDLLAADGRATLTFPSPYLRNAPARSSSRVGECRARRRRGDVRRSRLRERIQGGVSRVLRRGDEG